jgi:heptosyltransferase-2
MGTPTLTIFGPTVPEFGFGPLAERHAVAGLDGLSCRPCHRHGPQRCPLGHWRCMRELGPEYIATLLTEVLNPPVPV